MNIDRVRSDLQLALSLTLTSMVAPIGLAMAVAAAVKLGGGADPKVGFAVGACFAATRLNCARTPCH